MGGGEAGYMHIWVQSTKAISDNGYSALKHKTKIAGFGDDGRPRHGGAGLRPLLSHPGQWGDASGV
eukprot:259868-Amorphochlora_amoeboformis.AAC.1